VCGGVSTSLAEFGAPKRRMYKLLDHRPGGGLDGGEAVSIIVQGTDFRKLGGYNFVGL
jgi:hypothetical protein